MNSHYKFAIELPFYIAIVSFAVSNLFYRRSKSSENLVRNDSKGKLEKDLN